MRRSEPREFARGPEGAIEEVENKTRFVCQKRLRVSWDRGKRDEGIARERGNEMKKRREKEREMRDAKERKGREKRSRRSELVANLLMGVRFKSHSVGARQLCICYTERINCQKEMSIHKKFSIIRNV